MHIPSLLLLLPLTSSLALPSQQSHFSSTGDDSTCDCSGTSPGNRTDPPTICDDSRRGPVHLPAKLPLLSFVDDYDRFGTDTPGVFLQKWTNATTGRWIYPASDGFSLDVNGNPILGNMTLIPGTKVDRFGYESGKYISAADAPYNQRSLPPDSLNTGTNKSIPYNYHIYSVKKLLPVVGGPIAPWFGQPGLGAQFYVGDIGNITVLLDQGYLERLSKSDIEPGPGHGAKCGQ